MPAPPLLLQAVMATPQEQSVIRRAAERLADSLDVEGRRPWRFECVFLDSIDEVTEEAGAPILLTSLLSEVTRLEEPWDDVERRLRDRYIRLVRNPATHVYVFTVFRHIAPDQAAAHAATLRVRIRRLNLLAVRLSQALGVFLIDLDREFADVGGGALRTDYRLVGDLAVESAADLVAATVLATGLDGRVPFDAQDAAMVRLAELKSSRTTLLRYAADNTVAVRSGRRVQRVQITGRRDDQAAFFWRQLVSGKVPIAETAARIAGAVSRRGLRASLTVAIAGLRRVVRTRARRSPSRWT